MAFFVFMGAAEAYAASEPDFAALQYSKIVDITMAPGEKRQIKIGFYNKGRYNWRRDSRNFVSVYTDNPHYRQSLFQDGSWYGKDQPTKLKDALVGPGKLGYFEFYLSAPLKRGVYEERFALAAEDKLWLPGGKFVLQITVSNESNSESSQEKNLFVATVVSPPKLDSRDYKAERLSRIDSLFLKPGEETAVGLMFLNKGKKNWTTRQIDLERVDFGLVKTEENFSAANWLGPQTSRLTNEGEVKSGQTDIFQLSLKAPLTIGVYTLHFNLKIEGKLIEGGGIDLPVVVGDTAEATDLLKTMNEPTIRIGLYTTEEPIEFTSSFAYQIKDANGQDFGVLTSGEKATVNFNASHNEYVLQWPQGAATTTAPARFEPLETGSFFTIANYENHPRENKNLNDNKFRGTLEIRFSSTGYLWVINELAMESYLKGLAEASENSPLELQKAILTAARSYAFYHLKNPDKHEKGGFILDADVDQVYRGYGFESRSPKLAAAIEATRGLMVTYDGEVVPTPYFARSNGRTRTWKHVWGGQDKPWLQSVATPYDKGYSQLGHGVGMSAHDALYRAKKGAFFEDILKYYYTGVELQKVY